MGLEPTPRCLTGSRYTTSASEPHLGQRYVLRGSLFFKRPVRTVGRAVRTGLKVTAVGFEPTFSSFQATRPLQAGPRDDLSFRETMNQ